MVRIALELHVLRNTGCVGRRCPILNIASKMACGSGCGYLARFSRHLSTRLLWARLQSSLVPAVSADDERVQELMRQLTGLDLDKVFSPRREPLQPPIYKLMTLNELEKVLPIDSIPPCASLSRI